MDLTTVQDKISEMESARKDLLKQGYAANHPRIQSIDSELSQLQLRYASLIAGAHNALKIDADMGAAGVKVLQERIAELKTALNGRPTTDTGPTPSQLFHLEVANSPAKTGPGTLEFTDPGNSDATSLSLYKPLLNKYAWAAKYSTPLASPSPQPDYSNWLAHADPNEKDAMAAAFKAVDDWHAAIDSPNASANTAPQTISGQSVTAEDWQAYLAGPYSKWGPVQSRRLHMMMRGWVDGAKADAITNLTLVYEIKHLSPSGVITVLEDLKLSRGPDHPWHVDDYVSAATAISQPAPDHVESPPLIRSIDVEFVGKADEATKSKVLAASGLEVGSPYTVIRARRALRQIFATELLTNAAIKMTPLPDGVQVILVVQPNPTITEVSFEGIPADEQARLAARVHLHTQKGAMGSDYLAFQDAQAITSELAAEGLHLAAKGSTKLLDLAQGTASVTFTIAPPLP